MSFILDALRKSEHERQRRAGPVVADLGVTPRRSNALPVMIAVGALLAINLAVIAYFALRDDAPPASVIAAQETPPPTAAAASPVTVAPPVPVAAPAPVAAPQDTVARVVRPLVAEVGADTAPQAPDATPPPAPDPLLLPPRSLPARAAPRVTATEDYIPRLDTLPPQATAGLPPLNLDLHIFAANPAGRAAFINGRRYREGDTTSEGVEVVAITAEGAVLRYRGQRFLLARP